MFNIYSQLFLQIYPSVIPSQPTHTWDMRNKSYFLLHDYTNSKKKQKQILSSILKKTHVCEQMSAQVLGNQNQQIIPVKIWVRLPAHRI